MRLYFRKWMIVAFPADTGEPIGVSLAQDWNKYYMGERLNRYFSLSAAEMDAAEYTALWGQFCTFRIVDRRAYDKEWSG